MEPAPVSNVKLYAASAAVLAACIGLGAVLGLSSSADTAEEPAAFATTPLPPEVRDEVQVDGPTEVTVLDETATGETPTGETVAQADDAVDTEDAFMDEDAVTDEDSVSTRRRRRRQAARMNPATMETTTDVSAATTTRMTPVETAMSETRQAEAPRMNGPLVGIDAFDRELNN